MRSQKNVLEITQNLVEIKENFIRNLKILRNTKVESLKKFKNLRRNNKKILKGLK